MCEKWNTTSKTVDAILQMKVGLRLLELAEDEELEKLYDLNDENDVYKIIDQILSEFAKEEKFAEHGKLGESVITLITTFKQLFGE